MTAFRRSFSKYGSKRVEHHGMSFASKFEAAVYDLLYLEMKAGLWTELAAQVQVKLSAAQIIYKPDFKTVAPDGSEVFHEAKGFETDVWRVKRKLWTAYGPAPLRIYKGSVSRIYLFEEIIPKGEE